MDTIETKSPVDRYKAIANAIREKNGTTELMKPADMPQAILDIVSGGGANYESIVYNEDNTITLTDKDGTEHTMSCTYEDDKLIGVTYDGKAVELTYNGDVLVKVGKTEIGLSEYNSDYVIKNGKSLVEITYNTKNQPSNVIISFDNYILNTANTSSGSDDWADACFDLSKFNGKGYSKIRMLYTNPNTTHYNIYFFYKDGSSETFSKVNSAEQIYALDGSKEFDCIQFFVRSSKDEKINIPYIKFE